MIAVFLKPDSLRLLARVSDRESRPTPMTSECLRLLADRIEALEAAHAALLAACEAFVGYYDQAGIGDCTDADEEGRDDGFDGDEVMNVRLARAAIALATGQEGAK